MEISTRVGSVALCVVLILGVAPPQRGLAVGIQNGDFENVPPAPLHWRKSGRTRIINGLNLPAPVPPSMVRAGLIMGSAGGTLSQTFNCTSATPPANPHCRVIFSARLYEITDDSPGDRVMVEVAGPGGVAVGVIPVGPGTYAISIPGCNDATVVRFWVFDPTGEVGSALIVDDVLCQCAAGNLATIDLVSPEVLPAQPAEEDIESVDTLDCDSNGVPDVEDLASGAVANENNNFIPDACEANIPTVSEWGLIIMTLLLLTAGTLVFRHRTGGAVDVT